MMVNGGGFRRACNRVRTWRPSMSGIRRSSSTASGLFSRQPWRVRPPAFCLDRASWPRSASCRRHGAPQGAVVIDDQDRRHLVSPSCGKYRANTAPSPAAEPPARRSSSRPPCASASSRAIARPRPVPSARPVTNRSGARMLRSATHLFRSHLLTMKDHAPLGRAMRGPSDRLCRPHEARLRHGAGRTNRRAQRPRRRAAERRRGPALAADKTAVTCERSPFASKRAKRTASCCVRKTPPTKPPSSRTRQRRRLSRAISKM